MFNYFLTVKSLTVFLLQLFLDLMVRGKKSIVSLVLILVYSIVVAHSVIPHHHHSDLQSIIACSTENADNDQGSCDHHHSSDLKTLQIHTACDLSEEEHNQKDCEDACSFNFIVLKDHAEFNFYCIDAGDAFQLFVPEIHLNNTDEYRFCAVDERFSCTQLRGPPCIG